MRKTIIVSGAAALSLMLFGGAASAQETHGGRHRVDADGDGRISQAEFIGRRTERLARMDADRDGSLTAAEAHAGMQARRNERMGARFDRLDANRDGAISRTEFEAAREARAGRAHGQRANRGPRMERRMERMERRGPVSIEQVQTRAAATFARLDADRDGYLTAEERRAGRQQMRAERQARRAERQAERGSQAAPATE